MACYSESTVIRGGPKLARSKAPGKIAGLESLSKTALGPSSEGWNRQKPCATAETVGVAHEHERRLAIDSSPARFWRKRAACSKTQALRVGS